MQNRRWQEEAFEQYRRAQMLDWLCEATPGSGKTRFGLQVARWWLETQLVERVVIVCPTVHLRFQWALAAHGCDLALDPAPVAGLEGPDFRGAILTYQQIAADPDRYGALCRTRPTGVVFDEIHHAGDSYRWGVGLQRAFATATRRLALSGTPFRSDGSRIPFVRYDASGFSEPDFRYSYADALREGICRSLSFPAYAGIVSWRRGAGPVRTVSFREELSEQERQDRLRAAVFSTEWLEAVLQAAHRQLIISRSTDPTAGGLVIAQTQEHARLIARRLRDLTGQSPQIAVSEEPNASRTIFAFARSQDHWLVAVNMVSEGVDIARLRVGVYASAVTTELYFRQVAGRFVRMRPDDAVGTEAWLFIPYDPVLLSYAADFESTKGTTASEKEAGRHHAREIGHGTTPPLAFHALGGISWEQEIVRPMPMPNMAGQQAAGSTALFEQRAALRAYHERLVRSVARTWGLEHRSIHRILTRESGRRVHECSVQDLCQRIIRLEHWLRTGGPPAPAR